MENRSVTIFQSSLAPTTDTFEKESKLSEEKEKSQKIVPLVNATLDNNTNNKTKKESSF